MKNYIYCTTTAKGEQTFYLMAQGTKYFLFVQAYADALEEAKNGEIPKKRGKLQEQVIALTVANKDLTGRLDRSMQDTLDMVKENGKLKSEKDKDVKYAQVGKYIASNAPNLYRNILNGANSVSAFFSAVEDLCKPSVTSQVPRLQQIEAEIEEERVKHESKNRNYKYYEVIYE